MTNTNKLSIINVILTWTTLILVFIMLIAQATAIQHERTINNQLSKRLSELETNQLAIVITWEKLSKENDQFNKLFIEKVKQADDILDKKISQLQEFDFVVVERLKAVSEAQNAVIKTIIGLSITNSVDK